VVNATFDFTLCRGYLGSLVEIYDLTGRKVTGFEADSPLESIYLQHKGIFIYRILDKKNRQVADGKFYLPDN